MSEVNLIKIEKIIYVIRGQKVMLDSDLATLYEVETRTFNQAVKRNQDRFPEDFMFQLDEKEYKTLKNISRAKETYGGRRYLPMVFTESGVAMLSSVLTSGRAAQVNISIMRTFIKLRSFLAMESSFAERVGKLERSTNQLFKVVFERLDDLEDTLPDHPKDRKRIGIKPKED